MPSPSDFQTEVLARLVRRVLAVLVGSSRLRVADEDRLRELCRAERPVVLAAWHHELLLLAWVLHRTLARHGAPLTALVSRSRDGDLGARVGELLGATVVRGSSSRGGGPAMRRLVKAARAGSHLVVVPDGPRGPAREPKPGLGALSRLLGAPIVPLGFAARRGWRLRSWDRTVVPRPFGVVGMAIGPPLEITTTEMADDTAVRLVRALDEAEARAVAAVSDSAGPTDDGEAGRRA